MKTVTILPVAAKFLRRNRADAERIIAMIETDAADPKGQVNNVKRLVGSTALRLRVGDFRVLFEETDTAVIVTKIGPRGSVYD